MGGTGLKRETARGHIETVLDRVKTERMPDRIVKVKVFGSYLNTDKDKIGDIDILLITERGEYADAEWDEARMFYLFEFEHGHHGLTTDYYPHDITTRLLTRGCRNIHISWEESTNVDISPETLWEKEGYTHPTSTQHPLKPYVRFFEEAKEFVYFERGVENLKEKVNFMEDAVDKEMELEYFVGRWEEKFGLDPYLKDNYQEVK